MNQPELKLPNEKLIAYNLALDFHHSVMPLARMRGLASLREQLLRAADSVVLNLAEGAGRISRDDKARFYAIAQGSLIECAAVLDCLRNRGAITPATHAACRAHAVRLYRLLSSLAGPPR